MGKDKSGVGTGTLHQGVGELLDEDELDLLGTPTGKKRKAAPKKKKAKNRADRAKVRTMLSKNAATIATLRYGNNQETVDAMVKRMKSTAAQEEEERRKKAEALKPREVIDDEDDIILPSSPPPSTANNPTAAGAGETEKIVIKVSEPPPSSGKHEFRISKTDKIGKVIQKMGEILGSEKTFVLMFDGEKLTPDMTPEQKKAGSVSKEQNTKKNAGCAG